MKKSPLAEVRDRFGSKAKLIDAVRKLATDELWVERTNEDKGLDRVSNRKLLHLYRVLSEVKEQFGGRGALIDAILQLEKRSNDEGYRSRLEEQPTPRLLGHYRSAKKH